MALHCISSLQNILSTSSTGSSVFSYLVGRRCGYVVPKAEYIKESFLNYICLLLSSKSSLYGWSLDQSIHPWNPTLEQYTTYMIMDLKAIVVAIEELQSNAKVSGANAIREKV